MIDIWFPNLRGADLTWGFIRRRLNEFFGTLQRRGLSGFTTEHHESRLTFWLVHVQHSRETLGGMYIEAFLIFGVNVSGQAWSMFNMNYWATADEVPWSTLSPNRRTRQGGDTQHEHVLAFVWLLKTKKANILCYCNWQRWCLTSEFNDVWHLSFNVIVFEWNLHYLFRSIVTRIMIETHAALLFFTVWHDRPYWSIWIWALLKHKT